MAKQANALPNEQLDLGSIKIEEIESKLTSPLQIQWTVSRYCNFNCPHCFNNSGKNYSGYEPPREIIIENICDAKPYNVCLCGGEPFTWNDTGIITRKLRDGGIPIVSLVTNAYLATEERLRQATDEGLNMIQISFDGATPEEHAKYRPSPNSWKRAHDAIAAAAKLACFRGIAVSFLPNRYNADSFEQFVQMVIDIGATEVRVQPLMSSGRAAQCYDALRPTAEQYIKLSLKIEELKQQFMLNGRTINILWGDPLEHIYSYTQTNAKLQYLSIQVDGWYELSPYIPVRFGDATKYRIREFWKKHPEEMWKIPLMLEMAEKLKVLHGMREIKPRIYFEEPVLINRFDDKNWALAQETSDVELLIQYAKKHGYYDYDKKME